MNNKFKINFLHPISILLITIFFYSLRLWSTNFTPRMFFYTQNIDLMQLDNSSVKFNFYSEENYLGIIFFTDIGQFIDPNAEELLVSISKTNSNKNIHTNSYNAHDLINKINFSFGFPIQINSKNEQYNIKIQVVCFEKNHCNFHPKVDNILVRHYFSKQYLFKSLHFIFKKIFNSYLEESLEKNLIIILSPALSYFFFLFIFKIQYTKFIFRITNFLFSDFNFKNFIFYILLVFDLIIQKKYSFFITLFILSILSINYFFKKNKIIFKNVILFFLISFILITVNFRNIGDRLSIWVYVLFIFYIYQITFLN